MSVADGERRVVSVLVADVAGSTAIGERLGPERSKFLFDEVVRLMREEVERFGGTVAQLTGDGVLALFGAPVAHEDDSERAVRAALAIQEAVARYARGVEEAYGIPLAARVAVNTGPVVVPSAEAPAEERYNALGDTVNVAARLQALGDVVVGPVTARQIESSFELAPLGPLELKGKTEPVPAFRVTGERIAAAPAETPFFGRDRELEKLLGALETVAEGGGVIISITGEPGIGKSRIVREAERRCRERVRCLAGHAASYAAAIPYWPVRDLLRAWLGVGVSDPEMRVRLELKAGLAQVLADGAGDAYPFLATALGLSLEGEDAQRVRELSRDGVHRQTLDAVMDLVRALSHDRPLCLVLEDLHWADEATLALVEELLPLTDEEPVGLVLLYRNEPDHPSSELVDRARRRYRHRHTELDLGPLDDGASIALAAETAGGELPQAVAGLLAERAGGNPFFLEEALRDLVERGVLQRKDGRFEVAVGLEELRVPAIVQEALQARLDRLGADAREVIGAASVVGRTFGLPLLERLVPRERLVPALSELQRFELIVEERRRPAPEYRFRHGLVQEAAYAALVEQRRRDLHRRGGEALEVLHQNSLEEVYGLLARHFAEADDADRAVEYLLRAGDAARALFADQEALEYYRRALDFLDRLGDHARARETLFKVALAHHLAFDFAAAARAYEEAFSRPEGRIGALEPTEAIEIVSDSIRQFTPGYSYDMAEVVATDSLFRGLLRLEPGLNVVPELAERFSVSDDGRTYRFTLRSDARWSDGEPVSPDDFRFALARIRAEGAAALPVLEDLEAAETVNERTLELRLREPRSYFPFILAQPWFYPWPRHRVEELGDDWRWPKNLVVNGPFLLDAFDGKRALLVANPRWTRRRGNVREVRVMFPAPDAPLLDLWREGRFDGMGTEEPAALDEPRAELSPVVSTRYVAFNSLIEPFTDERVRRAFAHAVDRQRVAELVPSVDEPALRGGAIPPALPGHSHRVAPEFDLDRGRALLAEAGFPGGKGLPELVLAFPDMSAADRRAGEHAAGWRALGARVRVQILPGLDIHEAAAAGAHLWCGAWVADYPDPDGFLRTFLDTYPAIYRDREIEALLRRARSLTEQGERLRLYRELERLWLFERAAVVPIVYPRSVVLTRPWIEGAWTSPLAKSVLDEIVVRPELRP